LSADSNTNTAAGGESTSQGSGVSTGGSTSSAGGSSLSTGASTVSSGASGGEMSGGAGGSTVASAASSGGSGGQSFGGSGGQSSGGSGGQSSGGTAGSTSDGGPVGPPVNGNDPAGKVAGGVRWVGRVDTTDPTRPKFNWGGSGFIAQVATTGPSLGVALNNDQVIYFQPIVDGVGTVRIDDSVWRVSGPDCPAGSRVKIARADGANLTVEAS